MRRYSPSEKKGCLIFLCAPLIETQNSAIATVEEGNTDNGNHTGPRNYRAQPKIAGIGQASGYLRQVSVEESTVITSPVEAALARLWSRILRVNDVGRNEDFLSLGGDRPGLVR